MIDRPRAGEPTSIQKPRGIAAVIAAWRSSAPPARSPRPKLPPAVLGRAEIDWRLTIIAAFSFLAHFGVVGTIYSDWLDPMIDDGPTIQGLVDALRITPAPPPDPTPIPEPTASASVFTSTIPTDRHGGTSAPATGKPAAPSGGGDHARMLAQAAAREMAIISALGGSGHATSSLRDGQATTQLLDDIAASREGIVTGHAPGLRLGAPGGDTILPGQRSGLQDIGGTAAGVPTGAGSGTTTKAPSGGTAHLDPLVTRAGNVPNADHTVAGLKASYRRCYMRGLESMPDAEGSVELSVKISANGEVASVIPSGGARLGSEIVGCLVRKTSEAHFDPPLGGVAAVAIPITFALQR